jgi:branched-chain amino acid transport system substrate-binding protein
MENLTFETPAGTVRMALGNGHQAIQDNAVGVAVWDETAKKIQLKNVMVFKAECVILQLG